MAADYGGYLNHNMELEALSEFPHSFEHAIWWMELAGYKVKVSTYSIFYVVHAPNGQYVGNRNRAYVMECAEHIWREYYDLNNRLIS